ncbi:DDB1- and CUL4-associated factor 5-like [Gigantopelta aegis]|uniref:DDB1- and CUL4-associated factor 5-like n=1 Tax=Gigantopelta aegis TaxID=1735272 RepID=UPI001B88A5D3|nr:DDB1- and CUL4-associated factor 5-like [Gigantopelta aegis]
MAASYFRRNVCQRKPSLLNLLSDRVLSCEAQIGKDFVQQRISSTKTLFSRDLKSHFGCINAIEFSNDGEEYIISGGDDRRVLLWNVYKAIHDIGQPISMKGEHNSNIFCLAFNNCNKKIFSGGNDEQVVVHDVLTGATLDVFRHEDAVYGLSADPNNDSVFASACDDGRVLIFDIREPPDSDPFCLANYTSSMHAVTYNPMEPRLLAIANAWEGVGLWDIRKPKTCLLRYGGSYVKDSCMSVRISKLGTHIIALHRRQPPVLYNIHSAKAACEFDHNGYYNSCTMKSCSFAGDRDQYILSGSDDFNLYMWKIPEELEETTTVNEAHAVLKGHRSIVNQVRYSSADSLIISSGVEKVIKLWSPFVLPACSSNSQSDRPVYTPEEYINLVLRSGHIMSHDYTHQSTEEDPRMMAFFDSLVQGEVVYGSTEEELSSDEEEMFELMMQARYASRRPAANAEPAANESVPSEDVPNESVVNNESIPQNPESSANHVNLLEEDSMPSSTSSDEEVEREFSPFTLAFASAMAAQTAGGVASSHNRLLDTHTQAVLEGDAAEAPGVLDGQLANSQRKSIAEIIAQNRQEIQRVTEIKNKLLRSKKKSSSKSRLFVTSTSSDTDSEQESAGVKPRQTVSYDSSADSVIKIPNNSVKCHLKRLRDLRNEALETDCGSSDAGASTSKKQMVNEDASPSVIPGCSNSCRDINGSRLGPYINELDLNHNPPCSESNSVDTKSTVVGIPSKVGSCDSNTPVSNSDQMNANSGQMNANNVFIEAQTRVSNNDISSSTLGADPSTSNSDNTRTSESCSYKKTSKPKNNTSNNDSKQPVWSEFKRFKNKVERARRYYRKHTSSDDDTQ